LYIQSYKVLPSFLDGMTIVSKLLNDCVFIVVVDNIRVILNPIPAV
jgi:hypothetical protein